MITNPIVNKAINYIIDNLESEISLSDVASFCGVSKFHFSHLFKEETGESVYSFIKRVKVENSAMHLKVEKDRSITDVGLDYGYTSSNYSTLFRKHFNTSPASFRKNVDKQTKNHPFLDTSTKELDSFEECSKKITVEHFDDFNVLYERQIGNYYGIGEAWAAFEQKYRDIIDDKSLFIESTYNDPVITDCNLCIYDIGMIVPKDYKAENTEIFEGGSYAVYHFDGSNKDIYSAYQSLFCIWIPKTNNKIDNKRSFDIYHKIDCDNMTFKMDICIPLKK